MLNQLKTNVTCKHLARSVCSYPKRIKAPRNRTATPAFNIALYIHCQQIATFTTTNDTESCEMLTILCD